MGVPLLSSFMVDFIIKSCLFPQIDIVILMTEKYFLHCTLLFSIMSQKVVHFAATNERMNCITSVAQGQAASRNVATGRNFCFNHFTVEEQIDARTKISAIRRQTICRETLNLHVLYWKKSMIYTESVLRICKADPRSFAGKFYVTNTS